MDPHCTFISDEQIWNNFTVWPEVTCGQKKGLYAMKRFSWTTFNSTENYSGPCQVFSIDSLVKSFLGRGACIHMLCCSHNNHGHHMTIIICQNAEISPLTSLLNSWLEAMTLRCHHGIWVRNISYHTILYSGFNICVQNSSLTLYPLWGHMYNSEISPSKYKMVTRKGQDPHLSVEMI